MKKIAKICSCCALILCFSVSLALAENREASVSVVAQELKQAQEGRVILDIRTPEEFAQGHLVDAQMIDFLGADFQEKIAKLPRHAPYVLYCRTGARSSRAYALMIDMGFSNVLHMLGGYTAWTKAGLPVKND